MSILYKINALFFITLIFMMFFWYTSHTLQTEKITTTITQKYLQTSDELYEYVLEGNQKSLIKRLDEINYKIVKNIKLYDTVYEYKSDFGAIKVLKDKDNKYYLFLKYLEDELLLFDITQKIELEKSNMLDYIIIINILILIILFLVVTNIFTPLKIIANKIYSFGKGDYSARNNYNSKDEIGQLANTFDTMADNLQNLIIQRERLLKDIGHELRTPITKAKFALEMIPDSKHKNILQNAFMQIDMLTDELLEIEKFKTQNEKLNKEYFMADTLILEALSRLLIDEEDKISVICDNQFKLYSNKHYLSIAIKNLIDNAIKYANVYPIIIEIKDKAIYIKNIGTKLQHPLSFYTQEFTKDDASRNTKGYGLGLNIVKNIIDYYGYILDYDYIDGYNIFCIRF